jgi:hypothetical protein
MAKLGLFSLRRPTLQYDDKKAGLRLPERDSNAWAIARADHARQWSDDPFESPLMSNRIHLFRSLLALLVLSFIALDPRPLAAQLAGGMGGGMGGMGMGGMGGMGMGGMGGMGGGMGGMGGGMGGMGGGMGGMGGGGMGGGASGIVVDAEGVVRPVFLKDSTGRLDRKRRNELAAKSLPRDVNVFSPLRKVSLTRLEAACEPFANGNKHVPTDMQFLAGLQRIDYVFVDPENRDLVIAGPAEGYLIDAAGRAIGNSTGRPPLRLDDLLVAIRALSLRSGTIGCSIDPTEANLAKFKAFVSQDSGAISPEQARAKFARLGDVLGMQDVSVFGVPADSHFAEQLVEADIRMKRLSIGADRTPVRGFKSHLSLVGRGENTMQRWWFTPLYDAFTKSDDGLAFQFSGQRVQLMSQEELISDSGKRTNAPFSHVSTQKYSKQFTARFPELAVVTPSFAELQSLFDLAVLAALMQKERLPEKIGWPMALFLDAQRASLVKQNVPKQVKSISKFKTIGQSLYVAQVGGGVTIDPVQMLQETEFRNDSGEKLGALRIEEFAREKSEDHPWWWD